jgi:hypothetical protein
VDDLVDGAECLYKVLGVASIRGDDAVTSGELHRPRRSRRCAMILCARAKALSTPT